MIINVCGSNSPYQISRIELDTYRGYIIRLIACNAVFSSKAEAGIYKICTNLIERENGNSDRVLAYIYLDRKQTVLEFVPIQSCWYKLRLRDISFAEINIQAIESNINLNFKELACQFEITQDARLQ